MPPRVRDLLERKGGLLQLEALTGDVGLDRLMPTAEASSPGLVLAGFTARFAQSRIHVLGQTEVTYLRSLGDAARRAALETFFTFDLPCVVITKGQEPPADLLALAREKWHPGDSDPNCAPPRTTTTASSRSWTTPSRRPLPCTAR